jgi:hypothetical protein
MRHRSPAQPRTVTCAICGASFQTRHSQGKYCSEACTRKGAQASWNAYTDRNKEKRLEGGKRQYEKNREAVMERIKVYHQSPAGKAATRTTSKNQKAKFPEKIAARHILGVAVRKGEVQKSPCERCGAKRVHGHHPDYSKPLIVIWLCAQCHKEEHKRLKAIANQLHESLEISA